MGNPPAKSQVKQLGSKLLHLWQESWYNKGVEVLQAVHSSSAFVAVGLAAHVEHPETQFSQDLHWLSNNKVPDLQTEQVKGCYVHS